MMLSPTDRLMMVAETLERIADYESRNPGSVLTVGSIEDEAAVIREIVEELRKGPEVDVA